MILSVYLLLWLPPVQRTITDIALREVMQKTGNRISVGDIRLRPFRSLLLREVYAADLQGDTLLYVKNLSAGFRLFPLLNGRLVIRSVRSDDFTVNLARDSVGAPLNFQFFIDAFASGDTAKTSDGGLIVEIDDIRLARGRFSYDIHSAPARDSVFDAAHIQVRDLEAHVCLFSIDLKRLDVAVKHLSFREKSGLTPEHLSFAATSDKEVIDLKDLELKLPRSLLKISRATVDYTGMPLSRLADSARYALSLAVPYFRLPDLAAFAPVLNRFPAGIVLKSEFSGRFPLAKLDTLQLSYGENIRLALKASLADYMRWYDAPLELHIPLLEIKPTAVAEIAAWTKSGALPVSTGGIRLSADITGALPDLALRIAARSAPSGKLNIDGTGGFVFRTGETRFNLNVSADNFDLKKLLNNDPQFGSTSFASKIEGDISGNGRIDARADLDVERFDFRQHSYRDVEAAASYAGTAATFRLTSRDPDAPVTIRAEADLSHTPSARLYLKTAHLMPDRLNLTPNYKNADLFAVLNADIQGFDLEKMSANVILDSVSFTTSQGTAALEPVGLTYEALSGSEKKFRLQSKLMTVDITGRFSPATITRSFRRTLSVYFPKFAAPIKIRGKMTDRLKASISVRNTEQWARLLKLPFAFVDTARLTVEYSAVDNHIAAEADFPTTKLENVLLSGSKLSLRADTAKRRLHLDAGTVRFGAADTMHLGVNVKVFEDSLRLGANFNLFMPKVRSNGRLELAAGFAKAEGRKIPDITVDLFPAMLQFNKQDLHIRQALLSMKGDRFEIRRFEIMLSDKEYLKADGLVSRDDADTLRLKLAGIQIETLLQALQSDFKLKGEINGEISGNRLLTSPRILTEGLSVKDIRLYDQPAGTLHLTSAWSQERKGLLILAELERADAQLSTVSGTVFPQRDSLSLNARIGDLELAWLKPFTQGILFGLGGRAGANIKAEGSMKMPALSGSILLKDANIGVSMLNTQYRISDSIQIRPDRLVMKDFRITDENKNQALINGEVLHTNFSDFRPAVSMKFTDFLLLNNPKQTDSLFYGTLRADGSADVSGSDKDLLLKVAVKNRAASKVFVNIPEEQTNEARQYQIVTFVNKDSMNSVSAVGIRAAKPQEMPRMPVRLQLAVEATPELQLSAVYNPKTKDAATIKGAGRVDLAYDLNNSEMKLLGEYKITEGVCNISFRNITTKTFVIQPGGRVTFKGDPGATEFDVTAIYKVRADLKTLDPDFASDTYLTKTRVNTECHIRISGSAEKMAISYAIVVPDVDESVQRKIDALLATDDIKLKEIAYLLVAGTFYPAADTEPTKPTGNNIWTSLASSALTTSLNSLLDGVLSDNWTIGTELHPDDSGDNNIDVEMIISTNLFNDRLTVTGNIGYKNTSGTNSDASSSNTNFTGDFDVQYKLTKTGNLVLKMYNVTNDQYYEQARTTQGVGVMYRREAKRFRDLFKKIKR